MCQSVAEGGRRCAAHTRPRFQAALTAINTATTRREQAEACVATREAVLAHASTPTGDAEIAALIDYAETNGDHHLAEHLRACHADAKKQTGVPAGAPVDQPLTDVGEHWSIAEGGTRWHEGGCGAFAIGMQERWPHLKIAAEMYEDRGAEFVAHAWAYDPATNTRFHIFGAEKWKPTTRPDYDPDSHRVLLDQSPEDIKRLFRGWNTNEDQVMDGQDVAVEMFDPAYEPDPEYDRTWLYF